jgi:predicted solute-binding protein
VDLESALKQIKLIRNQDLRNVLMHYALSGGIPASDNPSYYDVYKYYLPNFSAGELNIQIHRGFTDIFTILKMWKQNKSV